MGFVEVGLWDYKNPRRPRYEQLQEDLQIIGSHIE